MIILKITNSLLNKIIFKIFGPPEGNLGFRCLRHRGFDKLPTPKRHTPHTGYHSASRILNILTETPRKCTTYLIKCNNLYIIFHHMVPKKKTHGTLKMNTWYVRGVFMSGRVGGGVIFIWHKLSSHIRYVSITGMIIDNRQEVLAFE